MTKIPVSAYEPPKPGAFTPEQRRVLSAKYPLIGNDKALRGVERILNELFIDIERYGLMPGFASTIAVIKSIKKTLDRAAKNIRALTNSESDPGRTFIALELEAVLKSMKADAHITLADVDDALGTVDVALDLVLERISVRYGGRKGAPSDVALDMWIERMLCLWLSVGGKAPRTWTPVKADNSPDDETADATSSGRRRNELNDLLVDLVAMSNQGFMPGGEKFGPSMQKSLTASALGQRGYHVDVAWSRGPASKRRRRKREIEKFYTSVLGARPPESGSVIARGKEARANEERDKRSRVRRAAGVSQSKRSRTKRD
ncbi:MAG: hypothetical protein AB7G35_09210 [Hyphomicrobiaceae bacterium]